MGPRNDEPRKEPQPRQEGRQRRFQIIRLEERIAPNQGGIPNGGNKPYCGPYGCCHGAHGKCFP